MTAQGSRDGADAHGIDALARDVARVEALRIVKDVQRRQAQDAQFGRWETMAARFAPDAVLRHGEEAVRGRAAIAAWLAARAGGMDGVAPGSLHTAIVDQPLVTLAPDGRSAKARWMAMRFLGDGRGSARIEGGLYENVYTLGADGWAIAAEQYHPQFEGDYASGWANCGGRDLPVVPYHFAGDATGVPIPPAEGAPPPYRGTIEALAARILRLNDEDAVRNLQNACGYYVDRRMWSDVVDLFAKDCAVQAGGEVFRGRQGVRRALERMGPEGLETGVLNERPIFDLTVAVLPGGTEAFARGIEIGLLAGGARPHGGWAFGAFRNRFVKEDGLWKLAELRHVALVEAEYRTGWGSGGDGVRGDAGLLADDAPPLCGPEPAPAGRAVPEPADLRRRLARSAAWDGVENVSSAYGFYLDDFQWEALAGLFAAKGNKQSPFAGYYVGRDRILGAAHASWGPPPALRAAISFHWRTQPVVHVSHDGRSANLRTRLYQPRTSKDPDGTPTRFYMGGLHGGMYPNDQAVLEDGVWRLWSLTIDEHYFASPDWRRGWAGAALRDGRAPPPPPSALLTKYPPDVRIDALGRREEGFRGGTGTMVEWPQILPMWFHYRNPVSGRVPDRWWPDCVPCAMLPESRMTAHGYQPPPTGPEIDGIDLPRRDP